MTDQPMKIETESESAATRELENLEIKIAKVLRSGVIVAGAFIFIGWMLNIQFTTNPLSPFHEYHPESVIQSVWMAWLTRDLSQLISYVGLLVLILLPILRVLLTGVLFLRQRDYILAGVAFFVFGAIAVSCALGFEL